MEITGTIKLINELESFDSGFTKRTFVVTTEEDYPQDIILETIKDKTSLLDSVNVGDRVTASINLRGNEYNGKYYVNIQAWRLSMSSTEVASNFEGVAQDAPAGDDLPF